MLSGHTKKKLTAHKSLLTLCYALGNQLRDERIRINYKTLRFYYKNGVVDELNIDENGSEIIDSNDGMVSYLKFDTVSKAKPKGLEIVFSDPYGKEVSILTEPNYKDI